MAVNLPTYFLNAASVASRTAEVPGADWESGLNRGGSCSVGLGINTGNIKEPDPVAFTLNDQFDAARSPQNSQHIGGDGLAGVYPSSGGQEGLGGAAVINADQDPDFNDELHYITATQQAVPDAVYDVASGVVNKTGVTIEIGETAWGIVPVA